MKRKTWFLLALFGMAIVAGGVLFLNKKIHILQLENTDRGRVIRLRVELGERFSIYYVHSIYKEPVIEEFEAGPDTVILKGVRTNSPAIAEQYGFDDLKKFHPLDEKLGAIFIRVGSGAGQGLILRDKKIYLSEVGERGDRIQLSVTSISKGSYFFSTLSNFL